MSKYHSGALPLVDKSFTVETIVDGKFKVLDSIVVTGAEVAAEMDEAESIKGHTHYTIARRRAKELFPDARTIVLTPEQGEYKNRPSCARFEDGACLYYRIPCNMIPKTWDECVKRAGKGGL